MRCVECGGDHGDLRHGQWLREEELMANERDYGYGLGTLPLNVAHPENCAECRGAGHMVEEAISKEAADKYAKIRAARGAYYGDVRRNHESIGQIWAGILGQAVMARRWAHGEPIPPDLVCLMMAGVKLSREAFRHKTDNIDDAQNYLDFVDELSEEGK